MLITRHPPAKLQEVEAKESSGEEEEIMGDKARTLEGEWERERERESKDEKSGSHCVQSENLLFLLLIMYE